MYIFIVSPYKETKNIDKQNFLKNRLSRLLARLNTAKLLDINLSLSENKIQIIGVDGQNYDPELDNYLSDNWRKTYLKFSKGNKGCSLSHIKIYQFIKDNNIQEDVLVLEDDALIHKDFKSFIPEKFPDDYHFYTLHKYGPQEDFLKQQIKFTENVRKLTDHKVVCLGLYAYFVNGRKISEILEKLLPLEWQIEFCTTNDPKFNNYFCNPTLKISGQETINDNPEFVDSYIRELNTFSKYFFMEFVNQEQEFKKISKDFIFEILCHCTMLHGVNINEQYAFIIEEEVAKNTFKKVENIIITHDWNDKVLDQEYQKLYLKINNPDLLKHNTNYKFTITYAEGLVDEVKKYISKSKYFTY